MIRCWLNIIFAFILATSYGQKLNSTISQDQILIGQPTSISYEVSFGKNDSILFIPKKEILEARAITKSGDLTTTGIEFEITIPFKDTVIKKGDSKTWIGEYVVTAWDSGMFIIPGEKVLINDSSFTFPDIAIFSYLTDKKEGIDIYDIKENYAEIPDSTFSLINYISTHWWWLLILIFGLIAFFAFRRKNKNEEGIDEESPISLKQRTLIAIEALEDAKLWERDQLKEHFVELSYILRSYLTSRYNITLLEKTTYETTIVLTEKGLNEDTVNVIVRILSQADMVKFAKSKPDTISILRISTLAKQIVAETSPLEFDNVK
ncbi:MAG: hypothetical protein MK105_12815 [Crocinitomicaceae bacterium]|nr:hypothetical protein [Crocinitomicaceae bacterium]